MIERIEAPPTWDGSEGLLAIIVHSDHKPSGKFDLRRKLSPPTSISTSLE